MSRIAYLLAAAALPMLGNAQEPGQDGGAALATNPFDRPGFVVNLGEVASRGPLAPPSPLELRTTIVGTDSALANINGQILSVGDIYDGYRVASIREGRVVLTKDGERTELDIYARQRGEDEERNELQ